MKSALKWAGFGCWNVVGSKKDRGYKKMVKIGYTRGEKKISKINEDFKTSLSEK